MQKVFNQLRSIFLLSPSSSRYMWLIVSVLIAAFLVRLVLLIFFSVYDQSFFYDGDSFGYVQPALNILFGNGFSSSVEAPYTPESFRTPGYPIFLLLHYIFFGTFLSVLFTQVILSVFVGYLILKIADEYFTIKSGIAAMIFFLFMPFSILASLQYTTLVFFSTLMTVIVWLWLRFLTNSKYSYLWATAILLPIAILVRPIALFFVVPLVVSLVFKHYWRGVSWRHIFFGSVVLGTALVAGLGPWIARNHDVFGVSAVSSLPPYQLYFFEDAAVYAMEHNVSFFEAREALEAHIFNITGKDYQLYRDEYIEFSELTPVVFKEGMYFVRTHPTSFIKSRLLQIHNFFVRDGVRYWMERFNVSFKGRVGFAIELYEQLPLSETEIVAVWVEKLFYYLVTLGFLVSVFAVVIQKNIAGIFLVLSVLYFAVLSGVMSSAPFRYPIEPLLLLLGVTGLITLVSFLKSCRI